MKKVEKQKPNTEVVKCRCGLIVKTSMEEYFCPNCGRHIVDPPPGTCGLCRIRTSLGVQP